MPMVIALILWLPTINEQLQELSALQGVWKAVEIKSDGKRIDDTCTVTIDKNMSISIDIQKAKAKIYGKVKITLSNPKKIDVLVAIDQKTGKPRIVPGIYKLKGDILTLCIAYDDDPRPKAFDTANQSAVLLVLKRKNSHCDNSR